MEELGFIGLPWKQGDLWLRPAAILGVEETDYAGSRRATIRVEGGVYLLGCDAKEVFRILRAFKERQQ